MIQAPVSIIGGGLAGAEAAFQLSKRGVPVELFEMRPKTRTEAHETGYIGEMVCSNSLGAGEVCSNAGLLKEELRRLDSFFIRLADRFRVPAGNSLAVDRLKLAECLDREVRALPGVTVHEKEVVDLKPFLAMDKPLIVASGPLTSPALAAAICEITMRKNLFFYDATCPLIRTESIDRSKVYAASRYEKGEADFLNIPLDKAQYDAFVKEITAAERVELAEFEKNIFFEACLPIEEIARRGELSLAFGPLKPVGLPDPSTGQIPYAVVQLRQDDLIGQFFQIVGFQTRLKWSEQKRIFRLLPGLENAEFERYGRMHRNTYINAPLIIGSDYRSKAHSNVYFAGQISGVEGYVESASSGLLASLAMWFQLQGRDFQAPPQATAVGSLAHYLAHAGWKDFRPTKFTFGLIPDDGVVLRNKKMKKEIKAKRSLELLQQWIEKNGI